jgi:nucleoside diphosphate kinase
MSSIDITVDEFRRACASLHSPGERFIEFTVSLDADAVRRLRDVALIVLSPDALLQGKAEAILEFWMARGMVLGLSRFIDMSEAQAEDVYRYNLNDGRVTWWLTRRLYSMGPSLAMVWVAAERGTAPLCERVTELKGAPSPARSLPRTVRSRFSATNAVANLMHASDSVVSVARESLVFFDPRRLRRLLTLDPETPSGRNLGLRPPEFPALMELTTPGTHHATFAHAMAKCLLRVVDALRNVPEGRRWPGQTDSALDSLARRLADQMADVQTAFEAGDLVHSLTAEVTCSDATPWNGWPTADERNRDGPDPSLLGWVFSVLCRPRRWNSSNLQAALALLPSVGIDMPRFEKYLLVSTVSLWQTPSE